jgi:outer membrane receptor protein involved in Fe transport
MRYVFRLGVMLTWLNLSAYQWLCAADLANCAGVVLDENAIPVPGAQVKLAQGNEPVHQTETDSAGRFAFSGLPAGNYQAEVRKQGFFVFSDKTLFLQPGTNEITLKLNHAEELHEQVQVAANANQIDNQDTAQRSTLTAQDIREVPVPSTHDLQHSLVALPDIVRDNGNRLHVAGARSADTQYLLDGFEIGDPADGTLTAHINVDATRTVEVQASRISAGYAHSGAGILSLETINGDDRWRFGTTDPLPGVNIQEGTHLGNWYPRFVISGPIERGRFWFSDSIGLQHTLAVVKEQPSGANTSELWAGDNLLRMQYNITPKHFLHAAFLYNRAHNTNLGLDALNPQSVTLNTMQHREFVSIHDQLWLHDTLIEAGLAADSSVIDLAPQGTASFVQLLNGNRGNFFESLNQHGRRLQALANIISTSRYWHGMHQFAGGANVSGLTYSLTAQRGEIQALNADLVLVRQTTFEGLAAPRVSSTQAGAYVQDTWSVSKRFVVQAGLRTDWDRFTQSAMAEPRLAVNFLPFSDGNTKLSIGWGIHNAPLNLPMIAQSLDQRQIDVFYNNNGTEPLLPPAISEFALPAGGLRQPRFTILSAGWQQKFKRNTLIGLELLARNGYHQFAYVDQQPAQPGGIFLLEDNRKDRYRSALISVRHQFSEATQVYAAYTRSYAHSNEVLDPVLGAIFVAAQQSGPLGWDAPNRLLTWGSTPTHIWGVQFSYFFEYRTGYPFSIVNLQQQLVEQPNSKRFPDYASLNVGLEKKLGFWGYLWAVRLSVINILGRENPDTVVNNIAASNFGTFSGGQGRAFTARVRFVGKK